MYTGKSVTKIQNCVLNKLFFVTNSIPERNQTGADRLSNAFGCLLLVQYIPKKLFEVKISRIKTTSMYKLIHNFKMLLTSKCTIKTLNTHKLKGLKLHSHVCPISQSDLFIRQSSCERTGGYDGKHFAVTYLTGAHDGLKVVG